LLWRPLALFRLARGPCVHVGHWAAGVHHFFGSSLARKTVKGPKTGLCHIYVLTWFF
jgi:hypothetical protein